MTSVRASRTARAHRAVQASRAKVAVASPPRRLPGAAGAFALLGEVLWVGVLVAVTSIAIITAPAAIAAGVRHLERHLQARETSVRSFYRDVRSALGLWGCGIGAASALVVGALVLELAIMPQSGIPGALPVTVLSGALLLVILVLLMLACASWSPSRGWRHALVSSVQRASADPQGALLAAVAIALTAVAGWQLPPLIVPALGCLVFAITVVRVRSRKG
jgi:hypothetical protein